MGGAGEEIRRIPEQGVQAETHNFINGNNDEIAKIEGEKLAAKMLGTAKEEAERLKLARETQKEGIKHTILVIAMWFLFLLACMTLGIYAAHILLPEKCHWLSVQQISKIETTFIGGIVGTMLQGLKRYV
jgi:hypothetical protein